MALFESNPKEFNLDNVFELAAEQDKAKNAKLSSSLDNQNVIGNTCKERDSENDEATSSHKTPKFVTKSAKKGDFRIDSASKETLASNITPNKFKCSDLVLSD